MNSLTNKNSVAAMIEWLDEEGLKWRMTWENGVVGSFSFYRGDFSKISQELQKEKLERWLEALDKVFQHKQFNLLIRMESPEGLRKNARCRLQA